MGAVDCQGSPLKGRSVRQGSALKGIERLRRFASKRDLWFVEVRTQKGGEVGRGSDIKEAMRMDTPW